MDFNFRKKPEPDSEDTFKPVIRIYKQDGSYFAESLLDSSIKNKFRNIKEVRNALGIGNSPHFYLFQDETGEL